MAMHTNYPSFHLLDFPSVLTILFPHGQPQLTLFHTPRSFSFLMLQYVRPSTICLSSCNTATRSLIHIIVGQGIKQLQDQMFQSAVVDLIIQRIGLLMH